MNTTGQICQNPFEYTFQTAQTMEEKLCVSKTLVNEKTILDEIRSYIDKQRELKQKKETRPSRVVEEV